MLLLTHDDRTYENGICMRTFRSFYLLRALFTTPLSFDLSFLLINKEDSILTSISL